MRDTLLRASNASDVFAKSIHDGNTAWRDGSALIKEANKRYATTESRLRIARNRLDDFAITMGETFLPVIGGAADTLGGFLDVLNGMPKPAKQALGILGGISGVVLGIGGAALIAVPKIQDFTDSLRTMGRRGTAVANGLSRVGTVLTGPWGIAIAAGITAIAIFTKKKADAAAEVRDFTRAMIQDGDAIGGNTRVLAAHKLEEIGALERAQDLGISVSDYTDAVLGNKDALERVNGALEKNGKVYVAARYGAEGGAKATRQFSAEGKFLDETLRGMNGTVNEAVKGARRESAAARDGAGAAKKHGRSVQGEANAMDRAQISAQDLKNALDRLNGRTLNMRQSERAFQQAVDDARKALHRNGKTLDIHTQKGRDNQQQLDHIAQSTLDLVDSEKKNDASNKQLRKTMERGRKKLIQTAKQMGMTRDEAKKLADKILAVPDKLKVPTSAPGANKSKNEMDHLHDAMRRIDNRDVHVKVKVRGADAVAHAVVKIKGHGVATGRYATGGEIVGPGSATSDSVLIRASRGEHMLSAREVRGFGGHGAVKQLRASARTAPGYAAGGPVRVHASTRGVEGMIHRLERLNRSIGYAAGKMGDFAERRLSMSFGFGGGGSAVSAHGPVVDIVRRTAAQFGWGSGAQWNALKWLIMHESGFRPTAQNPTSSAYGLFQFLDGTWGTVGGHKTSNPALQSLYGMRYVGSRYGSPLGAQSFWQGHHWYDNGGVLKPGATMAINRTGRDEVVLSPAQAKALGAQAPPVVISGPMVLEVDGRQFDAYLHSRQDKHDRGLRQRA
ncbi:MAG: phage tail tape measure protein, partial [Streptosporangiales bacterium]